MGNKPWLKFILIATLSLLFALTAKPILSAIPTSSSPTTLSSLSASSAPLRLKSILQTAQNLNEQGRQQLEQGDVEAALATWKQAEIEYQKANDENGAIGSKLNQSQALQALGRYRQAEQLLTQLQKTIQNKDNSELKATVYRSLGDILRIVGDLKQSENILGESLKIAQSLNADATVVATQLSLGNTAFAQFKRAQSVNDDTKAKVESQKAVNFYRSVIEQATSTQINLQAKLNLLSLLVEINQQSEAEKIWPEIAEAVNKLSPSIFAIASKIKLSSTLLKLNHRNAAILPLLTSAMQQAKALHAQRLESYVVGYLGQLYELNQQHERAIKLTETALKIAQSNQYFDSAYQWQWQLGRLYNKTGDKTGAIPTASHASAIAAYTAAVKTLESLRKNLVAINPEGQFSFRDRVEPVYRELVDLLLQPEPSQNNLQQARQVIENLQLAELENFFREACLQAKPEQIDEIIERYAPTAAAIYPIILPDRLEVILKLPGTNLQHHSIHISEQEVKETLAKLQANIQQPDPTRELWQVSQQVYDWLIKPFAADLENSIERENSKIKTLVFVLDGDLRNIPMSALYDGKKYLVERYAIAIAPGLQLLDLKPLPQGQIQALIAGATDAPSFEREGFISLPNVQEELAKIVETIRSTRQLPNEKFSKNNVENQLQSDTFSIVHLATHGKFSSDLDETFILDWNGRINIKDLDSLLRLSQQNGSNTIELLVLSACQTAQGDKRAALGLAGVAARAGARSTVATLWQADDRATARLMIQFYQQLFDPSGRQSKAEALRQAQLSFLTDFRYQVPYYWASFILLGNWV